MEWLINQKNIEVCIINLIIRQFLEILLKKSLYIFLHTILLFFYLKIIFIIIFFKYYFRILFNFLHNSIFIKILIK